MIRTRSLATSLISAALAAPLIHAQDLSRYREFLIGTSLLAISKQTDMKVAEAKTIHQRPALIQELEWHPPHSVVGSSLQRDSTREMLFSFYNGQLFRIVVGYDRSKTEGLTEEDMIEAISTKYGTATRPTAKSFRFSARTYDAGEAVIACWEDSQYSLNLLRPAYQPTFGLVVFSKRLDGLARAAIDEAARLDEQEAPQRELARQEKRDEEDRAVQRKARLVNKATFRP